MGFGSGIRLMACISHCRRAQSRLPEREAEGLALPEACGEARLEAPSDGKQRGEAALLMTRKRLRTGSSRLLRRPHWIHIDVELERVGGQRRGHRQKKKRRRFFEYRR